MARFTRLTALAMAVVLLATVAADACHRRRRCYSYTCYHSNGHCGHTVVMSNGVRYIATYDNQGRLSYYPAEQQGELLPPPNNQRNQFDAQSNAAYIDFRAPDGAQIWVDGQIVNRTGNTWRWTSPDLATGQRRSVEVKAQWRENGRDVNQTRSVNVTPGGRLSVDFTRPQGSDSSPASSPRRQEKQQPQFQQPNP